MSTLTSHSIHSREFTINEEHIRLLVQAVCIEHHFKKGLKGFAELELEVTDHLLDMILALYGFEVKSTYINTITGKACRGLDEIRAHTYGEVYGIDGETTVDAIMDRLNNLQHQFKEVLT